MLTVLNLSHKGHGPAIFAGYQFALGQKSEWIFQVDGNDQFDASDFKRFWHERSKSPFIVGHRRVRHDPFYRKILSHLNKILVFLLFGFWLKDPNLAFRLMKGEFLGELIHILDPSSYSPNVLLSILAKRKGVNFLDLPIATKPRIASPSHIHPANIIKLGLRFLWDMFRFRLTLSLARH